MNDIYLCPSMMCVDFGNLQQSIRELEDAGADMFHLDLMDGNFVPNFALGLSDIAYIREASKITVDVHMMVIDPVRYVEKLCDIDIDIIYIHPEADTHPARTLDMIKKRGVKAGIAINPGTSFESIKELLYLCDYVLVMTVNPGFAGQEYLDYVDEKILEIAENQSKYKYEIMVDGAISTEKIQMLSQIGVKGFILGTSALFIKDVNFNQKMAELRQLASNYSVST